jgi:hypothetical protein
VPQLDWRKSGRQTESACYFARSGASGGKKVCAALCPPGAVAGSCDAKKVGHGFVGKAAAHGRPPLVEPKSVPGTGSPTTRLWTLRRAARAAKPKASHPRQSAYACRAPTKTFRPVTRNAVSRAADRRTIAGDLHKNRAHPRSVWHAPQARWLDKRPPSAPDFSHPFDEFPRVSPSSDRLSAHYADFGRRSKLVFRPPGKIVVRGRGSVRREERGRGSGRGSGAM